ncbi:MAG: hypothetical protein PHF89_01260 [Eubacteriales bacterium]|jgi:hypothetical protein|nr:hypothetical protein [Eubacteriales bacterium]
MIRQIRQTREDMMDMRSTIVYLAATLSTFTLIVLWFAGSYQVLYKKRDSVYKALEELQLHKSGYNEKIGRPEEQTAKHMFEISCQIFEQIITSYNKTIKSPIYLIPGILMGFKSIVWNQKQSI